MSVFAGLPRKPGKYNLTNKGDGGPATKAVVHGARAVCVDGKGNTYICEREGNSIRKVDAKGIITTLAGDTTKGKDDGIGTKARFNGPKAIRCDAEGNVFVVDTENQSIRRIDAQTGAVTTVAGGRKGPEGDGGEALKAGMGRPHGLAIDSKGVLYIADSENHRIRRVR
jgi:sugar lactone lactonase YvrE